MGAILLVLPVLPKPFERERAVLLADLHVSGVGEVALHSEEVVLARPVKSHVREEVVAVDAEH